MWSEILIFGGILFWIAAFVAFCIITYSIESVLYEDRSTSGGGLRATLTLIGFVALYFLFGSDQHVRNILSWIGNNVTTVIFLALGYYTIGVLWSFAKWHLFLKFKASSIQEDLENGYEKVFSESQIPIASNYKARIISWMSYWPFSAFWTVIHKFVFRIWENLYAHFEGVYNRMSKSAFSDIQAKYSREAVEAKKKEKEERENAERQKREKVA